MNATKNLTQKISPDALKTVLHGGLAAFAVYFCMYAFRKPFSVAAYEGLVFMGISYKVVLVISQVIGYASSKFFGIKFISELQPAKRAWYIILFIGLAELALLGFALVPPPYNFFFLFLNGLPLGLIWGLVFSFLEGRRTTEMLAAILSSSFIVSSGAVKSVGAYLMINWGVSQFWMPFFTGLIFVLPLLLFVYLLRNMPPPTPEDIASRAKREPMTAQDRRRLFTQLAPGIVLLVLLYMFITAFRDFRDNFAVEIWTAVGYESNASVFTASELPISIAVLVLLGLFSWIRSNEKAFQWMCYLILLGALLVGGGNWAFTHGWIQSPMAWMILVGLGLYIAYVPFGSMLFDRLVAVFKYKSNAGFLIYVADAFGYLGSILILFYKEFFQQGISLYQFFLNAGYALSITGVIAITLSTIYFYWKKRKVLTNA